MVFTNQIKEHYSDDQSFYYLIFGSLYRSLYNQTKYLQQISTLMNFI